MNPPDVLDDELVGGLRRLKLRRIRQLAPELCITARTQRWRPEEFLRVLVSAECAARDDSNRELRVRTAAFPVVKTLEAFDVAASTLSQATFDYLASLEWIPQHRNVALVGPPGTGKSHCETPGAHTEHGVGHARHHSNEDDPKSHWPH